MCGVDWLVCGVDWLVCGAAIKFSTARKDQDLNNVGPYLDSNCLTL